MFYIISLLIKFLTNLLTNKLIFKKIENMGYVVKSKRSTKISFYVTLLLNFVPYLNITVAILNVILCSIMLNNEMLFLELTKSIRHNPDDVINECKRNLIKKDVLKDILVLDGASKEDIKEEFKKLNNYTTFASKEKGWLGSYTETSPIYNESDFNKAKALELAKMFLYEIESNVELSNKQKQKILGICKKEFLKDIKGKESKKSKSENKILKLVNND